MKRKRSNCIPRKTLILVAILGGVFLNTALSWLAGSQLPPIESFTDASERTAKQPKDGRRKARQVMPPRKSSHNTIGFVHIGKTGGSTLSTLLRNGCTSFVKLPCHNITNESTVSKLVEHYYHVPDFHRLPSTNHESFIVTVRDVYERTVSSYLYHHPKNAASNNVKLTEDHASFGPLAYSCFDTLEEFASLMKGRSSECNYPYRHNVVDASDCSALACAALHGRVRFFIHLFFNYQNILNTKLPTNPPRTLFAIRQEHLWEDWKKLNVLLGQHDPVYIPNSDFNQRNITGLKLPVSRDISSSGRLKLCEALETEYMAYFQLLRMARNLKDEDVLDAIRIAKSNCPNLDFQSLIHK